MNSSRSHVRLQTLPIHFLENVALKFELVMYLKDHPNKLMQFISNSQRVLASIETYNQIGKVRFANFPSGFCDYWRRRKIVNLAKYMPNEKKPNLIDVKDLACRYGFDAQLALSSFA